MAIFIDIGMFSSVSQYGSLAPTWFNVPLNTFRRQSCQPITWLLHKPVFATNCLAGTLKYTNSNYNQVTRQKSKQRLQKNTNLQKAILNKSKPWLRCLIITPSSQEMDQVYSIAPRDTAWMKITVVAISISWSWDVPTSRLSHCQCFALLLGPDFLQLYQFYVGLVPKTNSWLNYIGEINESDGR